MSRHQKQGLYLCTYRHLQKNHDAIEKGKKLYRHCCSLDPTTNYEFRAVTCKFPELFHIKALQI
jgi:hypothetical protein